jgi:hypothetical protein
VREGDFGLGKAGLLMIKEKRHWMHLAVFFFSSLRIELAVRRVIHF